MKIKLLQNLWWIAFAIALALLIDHSFKIINLTVDTISIFLLAIMLLSPFIAAIKKIKYGDFEAEIDIDEIKKLKSKTEKTLSEIQDDREEQPEIYVASESIRKLSESDPVIALAKVRIELEKLLGQIARFSSIEHNPSSLGGLVNKLTSHEIISQDVGKALKEVIALCNRAIHGEAVSEEGARTIIELGIELLQELYWTTRSQVSLGKIVKEEVITLQEVNDYYEKKKYRLTSITPLVENPKRTVRLLTQEQLDEYLDGYREYAEFIVDLVEVQENRVNDHG